MNTIKHFLLTILTIVLGIATLHAQIQKGQDIDGTAAGDEFGISVSMPDSNTLAIGAYQNDTKGTDAGQVKVYSWSGNTWSQKGAPIDGEAYNNYSGISVSMPDRNTVAIGAPGNNGTGAYSGHARIYSWNGSGWVQKGADINGEAAYDKSGNCVSMPDSNTIAIGATQNMGNGTRAGHVRIYSWNGTAWVQKGVDIDGEAPEDESGGSVDMPDANTVAIGALGNDGNGIDAGQVRVYSWDGNTWVQKGVDIDGEAAGDKSGTSVSMPDANTVAIGAPENDGGGVSSGHVRIYKWNGSAWVPKGADINGQASSVSGWAVSMPDINTVAIGTPVSSSNGSFSGFVTIYNWDGSAWLQKGADIKGEASGDGLGISISMPDANTIAAGASRNNDGGIDAGHVRVFSLPNNISIGITENSLGTIVSYYPNPSNGNLTIDLGARFENISVVITNIIGQRIQMEKYTAAQELNLNITTEPGVYFVEITIGDKKTIFKITKK